jgi:hypothetical protein
MAERKDAKRANSEMLLYCIFIVASRMWILARTGARCGLHYTVLMKKGALGTVQLYNGRPENKVYLDTYSVITFLWFYYRSVHRHADTGFETKNLRIEDLSDICSRIWTSNITDYPRSTYELQYNILALTQVMQSRLSYGLCTARPKISSSARYQNRNSQLSHDYRS